MHSSELLAKILACPDCGSGLNRDLACSSCGRSFVPQADGIVDALPMSMGRSHGTTQEIQTLIERSGPGEHGEAIVLFERAFHDEQARHYDTLFADPLPLRQYYCRLVTRQIRSFVGGQAFVVDLCCGTGKSSMPLIAQGIGVVGMDVSREMLRIYREKCSPRERERLLLIQADASHPPLRAGACGAITLIGGLHHLPDQTACLKICCGALAPSGLLILHEPLQTGTTSRWAALLKYFNIATDPGRVWRAIGRRVMGRSPAAAAPAPEPDFTPYEKPFRSPDELLAIIPAGIEPAVLRSQGRLSFREFSPLLQGRLGVVIASLVVSLDDWLSSSDNAEWSGDALYAVLRRTS